MRSLYYILFCFPLSALSGCDPSSSETTSLSTTGNGGGQAGSSATSSSGSGSGGSGLGSNCGGTGGDGGAGSTAVAQLALGERHTCARKTTGELFCWGDDDLTGKLGTGTSIITSATPLQVKASDGTGALSGVTYVAAGYNHTCAILSGGRLVCFGDNITGQLGNGTDTPSNLPVAVKGVNGEEELSGVQQVACGAYFTCALSCAGVYCWGQGPLGDGTWLNSSVPIQVLDPEGAGPFTDAVQIAAGESHVCVLKSDSTLYCFGENTFGQIGVGSTEEALLPQAVKNLPGQPGFLPQVDEIASLGFGHSCARASDSILCWGSNGAMQIGSATNETCWPQTPCATLPRLVQGIGAPNGAVELAVGDSHNCARLADHTIVCWGSNAFGQLGTVTNDPCQCSGMPVTVMAQSNMPFTANQVVSGSGDHTCALTSDGSVWCWGSNTFGQLGNNTPNGSTSPVKVIGL